jgi:hypothetical protein
MSDDEASRRKVVRRRLWLGLGGASVVVAIGLVVFVVLTLRERRSACVTMLGDLGEVERMIGKSLVQGSEVAGEIDCTVTLHEAGSRSAAVILTNRAASREAEVRRTLEAQRFASTEALPGGGTLFVFARRAPTIDDMMSSAAAPPEPADLATPRHHAVVFRHGDVVTELRLDSTLFDAAKAKAFAAAVANR